MTEIELLLTVCQHYAADIGFGCGTVGGNLRYKRMRNPQVGDFVYVFGALAPAMKLLGWLREIESNDSPYLVVYEVEHIDGTRTRWSNVECKAIPVGEPFIDAGEDDNKRMRP